MEPTRTILAPRTAPDPNDDQWMIGCEVLDRDFARFSAYKDYLPKLGIRSIRLQGGWAKCEKERGRYDFVWLDECVDFALAHGLNPILETDFGNPLYKGGGGRDLAAGFPYGDEGLSAWDRWVDALSRHFAPMENPATKQQSVGRRVRTVTLIPLEADDRDQFVRDNQASFNYGAFVVRRQS